ncbi:MAG: DUF4886 domain-containing protein [Oligosphaeraceae bacterium]|nr:DUF4886 domain-containing protein [Oligosphaeraceae bacterium]
MKILTIGNSFSESIWAYLPRVAASAGKTVELGRASFGGCELHRHWAYISAEENDSNCPIYSNGSRRLRNILFETPWDVVTIQQASRESWRKESYEPYAGKIIEYIRQYAPQAEILVQQTWAYRADSPFLLPGSEWGITQEQMYQALTENYRALAQRYGLRLIPTGKAVQIARQQEIQPFRNYDPELVQTLRWPDLPPQASDVVGQCRWVRDSDSGELKISRDLTHLNCRGQYLQACVWLFVLFGCTLEEITFVPEELSNQDAAFLRFAADKAVREGL